MDNNDNNKVDIEQLSEVNGGQHNESMSDQLKDRCYSSPTGTHDFEFTGTTRPGAIWGDTWPDYLYKCVHCGKTDWRWFNF